MGIPVKVSMYNVGSDMRPTGKDATTELGPMDSEQFVQIMGQIFEVTPRDWASGYSPPSFMLECPSGMQGFLLSFLSDPTIDLDAFLGDIQAYYDSLPTE